MKCIRCGEEHPLPECPYVKALEFHEGGEISRVEFWTPADYPAATPNKQESEPEQDYPRLGQKRG
jgi:hypothetical protein